MQPPCSATGPEHSEPWRAKESYPLPLDWSPRGRAPAPRDQAHAPGGTPPRSTRESVNRERYEAYVALRDAVAGEHERAAQVLGDLAEAMLLSRQAIEAQEARDRVGDELTELVGQGDLTRAAADRTWAQMRDLRAADVLAPVVGSAWHRATALGDARALIRRARLRVRVRRQVRCPAHVPPGPRAGPRADASGLRPWRRSR